MIVFVRSNRCGSSAHGMQKCFESFPGTNGARVQSRLNWESERASSKYQFCSWSVEIGGEDGDQLPDAQQQGAMLEVITRLTRSQGSSATKRRMF